MDAFGLPFDVARTYRGVFPLTHPMIYANGPSDWSLNLRICLSFLLSVVLTSFVLEEN